MAHAEDTKAIQRINEQVLSQEPNADKFATQGILVGAGMLGGILVLSWLGAKIHAFESLIHFFGGH